MFCIAASSSPRRKAFWAGDAVLAAKLRIASAVLGRRTSSRSSSVGRGGVLMNSDSTGGSWSTRLRTSCGCRIAVNRQMKAPQE